jgi:hypothetical protein
MNYDEEMKWLKDMVDGHGTDISRLSENINTLMRVVAAQERRIRLFEQKSHGKPNGEGE